MNQKNKVISILSALLSIELISISANANVPIHTNLMNCQNRGSSVGLCEVQTGTFIDKQSYESKLILNYDFNCTGNSLDTITLVNERGEQIRIIEGVLGGVSVLTGTGPFRIVDLDPEKTKRGRFESGCFLRLNFADIRPSESTLNKWSIEKSNNQINILKSANSRDGFSALANFQSAFNLLKNITDSMAADLLLNSDLRNKLDRGSPQRKLLEDLIFNSVEIKDPTTGNIAHVITRDEKLTINKLLEIVDHLPPITNCENITQDGCLEVTLDSYLSEDQKNSLKSLSAYHSVVDKSKEYEIEFANDHLKYTNQQIELCKISKMWIDWNFSEIPPGC